MPMLICYKNESIWVVRLNFSFLFFPSALHNTVSETNAEVVLIWIAYAILHSDAHGA